MGVMGIAKTIPGYMLSTFSMLSGVFSPPVLISYAKGKIEEMRENLLYAIKFLSFFSSIPLVCIVAYGKEFFELWVPGQNSELLRDVLILSTALTPFAYALEPMWNVFIVTNKIKKSSLFVLFSSIASIVLTISLLNFTEDSNVKLYIISGVSTLIGTIRVLIFLPIFGSKCSGVNLKDLYYIVLKISIAIVAEILLASLLKLAFPLVTSWIELIIIGAIIIACSILGNYFIILNKEDRIVFVSKIRSLICKIKEKI